MKNHLLGLSIANNILLKETCIDDALHQCVVVLGESQGIDRCYVLEIEKKSINYWYQHADNEVTNLIDKTKFGKEISTELLKIYGDLFKDEPIHGVVSESNSPSFSKIMNSRKVQTYLYTPIFSNSEFWGWLAYEDCKNQKKWISEEVQSLHLLAKNLGIRLNQDRIISELDTKLENLNFYKDDYQYGMWELDLMTFETKFSNYWAGLLGYTIVEFEHSYDFWKNNVHLDDILRVEKEFYDYISNYSDEYEVVFRMKHKKGNYVWLKFDGSIKRDRSGKPIKIIGNQNNSNESNERRIKLELAENKFRRITENTSDMICQHTIEGVLYYVSNSSKEILGYEPSEMINKIGLDFIHPDDFSILKIAHRKFIKTAKNNPVTYRFRKKNNSYVWLETTSRNITNNENVIVGIQTSSRDVSERIKKEQELKMALANENEFNDNKFKFLSMASHQFRTPLTVIYSNAELINMKINHLGKKIVDSVEFSTDRIKNEVGRINELMNNILVFGKYESRNNQQDIKPLDFDVFVKKLINTYFSSDVHGRTINLKIIGKKHIIFTKETLMTHILTNLIDNALKYSSGKPDPSLIITYLESEIEIQVIDFGIGIPENEIQNLFISFFRASNTNIISGSGLGLVIAKKFTEFLNGKIEVQTKEGCGTEIKLIFPYEQK